MNPFLIHFLIGCAVSFAGSIPLGTVNLIVIRAAARNGFKAAMLLAAGAVAVEAVYAFFSVKAVFALVKLTAVEYYVALVSVPVFLALGVYFLMAGPGKPKTAEPEAGQKSLVKGVLAGILNPLCIPFWMTWSLWLHTNGYLSKETGLMYTYLTGISIGTLALLALYAKLGKRAGDYLKEKGPMLNKVLGIIFLVLSVWQMYKFFKMGNF